MADWQWQLELPSNDKKKSDLLAAALLGGTVLCGVLAATTSARYWIVLTVMLASMVLMGRTSTRRLQSTTAVVDGPILTINDARTTTTIDLRSVDQLGVGRRSAQTGNRRWAVEAAGDGVVAVHQLAGLEMYLDLSEDAVAPLKLGLDHYHQWYRGQDQPVDAASTPTTVMRPMTATPTAPAARVQDDWEWRPARTPNADRNQRRVLIATIAFAAAMAAIGVQQTWGDAVGIALAILVLPSLILLLGLGCWYAYTPAKKFRLVVADGSLQVWRGTKQTQAIAVAGITDIVVDVAHSRNHSTNTNHSHPYVQVTTHAGSERIVLPSSLGVSLGAEERLLLERDLRQRVVG